MPGSSHPRVLHLIASLAIGGTEHQLVQFIERSSDPKAHTVAVFDELGSLASRVANPPILLRPVSRELIRWPTNLGAVRDFRGLVRGGDFDLVHAHLGLSEMIAVLATPRDIPIVASRRGRNAGFERWRGLKLLEGLCHRRVDVLVCNSRSLAMSAHARDLWTPSTRVIHNGIDLSWFSPAAMPTGPPTVVAVANLRAEKRHEDLLEALALVSEELPTVRGILVGDGAERARLQAIARDLGIGDRVEFAGMVADPRPFVARGHVVCLTSAHEGFPNALLEGMAMGRPVVATEVGGIPELVRHGVDGLLVRGEPSAIARGLARVLRSEPMRQRMSASARRRAEGFPRERVVRETESLYREVLGMAAEAPELSWAR